jgi:hypothetical protein
MPEREHKKPLKTGGNLQFSKKAATINLSIVV